MRAFYVPNRYNTDPALDDDIPSFPASFHVFGQVETRLNDTTD